MAPWVFDAAVWPSTDSPPIAGHLYWGENIQSTANGTGKYVPYISDYSDSKSMEECVTFASSLLTSTNTITQQVRADTQWDSRTVTRYNTGRAVRKALMGSEVTPLENAYWTYDSTPDDALYGATCHVFWDSRGTTKGNNTSVSGVVTREHNGKKTQCLYPRYSPNCMGVKSKGASAGKPDVCSGLNLLDGLGDSCRSWFDKLPDINAETNKTTIVNVLCSELDWELQECVCMNRTEDTLFKKMNSTGTFSNSPAMCWWLPCKNDDPAVRVTPAMQEARQGNTCPQTFCGNSISFIDSSDVNLLDQFTNNVQCTSNTTNNGSAPGSNSNPVNDTVTSSPAPTSLSSDSFNQALNAFNNENGSNIMMYVIIAGIALVFFVLALLAYKFTAPSSPSPVVNAAPVTTPTAPVIK